ncbi:LGFP repeat-containing protein [Mycobacterium numidiamassiliense]|uniref:LGFP repeat-containing protein n=1 Tax=Mycobacterium numidiamassiliense TaxID=1841861 RepID=UPI0026AF74C3
MNGQVGRLRTLVGRALVSLATTAVAVVLLAPVASASPIGDAEAAMMAEWTKAGGDTSPLGPRKGDVYPAGDGFELDFDGGKMFFTPATGARFIFGPILDKYEMLGGPAGSDLGFPTINEVPGLAGPDSRVATFSASDKPVIFWTPDHGAYVVRGALNAAWDRLGSSGGVLGAPVGDETYDGEVSSQKFSGGQISWNRKTKDFTTDPPALADQLKGLQVAIDPAAAINMAWRAAGGGNGPLGAKQGGQYPIGGDGIAQNFAGGKVFFSPATGANAIENDILAKYEALGGPVSSDLGFPTTTESDGGIGPGSRVCAFSGADKPVIFWTSDHGAFVVRGAMKAAWDKLRGASGKLGAPVSDQTVDDDVVSQKFTGGKISWNRAKNTFSTDPANLAPLLSGLQVAGQNQPSGSAMPSHPAGFVFHWWYLLAIIPLLILIALSVFLALRWSRRRARRGAVPFELEHDVDDGGYDDGGEPRWGPDYTEAATEHYRFDSSEHPPEDAPSAPHMGWPSTPESADLAEGGWAGAEYGGIEPPEDDDPDAVDTDSFPVVTPEALAEAGYPDAGQQDVYPDDSYPEAGYPEDISDAGYPEAAYPGAEAAGPHDDYEDVEAADAGYPESAYPDAAEEDAAFPDVAVPHTPPDVAGPGAIAAAAANPRLGRHAARHAAADGDDDSEVAEAAPFGAFAPAGRPTIHLPLDDPYQMPDGYPIKASPRFGLYYTPDSDLYHDTLAEIWLSSEEAALANGFVKAD